MTDINHMPQGAAVQIPVSTLPTVDAQIYPKGGLDILSREEVARLRDACGGDLDRVVRCVKIVGFVNATEDFGDHPKVVNGASDLMVKVFGDAGKHARSAVGMGSLPFGVAVEVEAIFEIK